MCEENLIKLRELTPKLMDYLIDLPMERRVVYYKTKDGELPAYGVFREGDRIAVLQCMIRKGDVFMVHHHETPIREFLFVYGGKLEVKTNGNTEVIGTYNYVIFENGVKHEVKALTDCKMIAVTLPADKSYP